MVEHMVELMVEHMVERMVMAINECLRILFPFPTTKRRTSGVTVSRVTLLFSSRRAISKGWVRVPQNRGLMNSTSNLLSTNDLCPFQLLVERPC